MSHSAMMSKISQKEQLSYSGSSIGESKANEDKPEHTSSRSLKTNTNSGDVVNAQTSYVDKKSDNKGLQWNKPRNYNSIVAKRADFDQSEYKESPDVRIDEIMVGILQDDQKSAVQSVGKLD